MLLQQSKYRDILLTIHSQHVRNTAAALITYVNKPHSIHESPCGRSIQVELGKVEGFWSVLQQLHQAQTKYFWNVGAAISLAADTKITNQLHHDVIMSDWIVIVILKVQSVFHINYLFAMILSSLVMVASSISIMSSFCIFCCQTGIKLFNLEKAQLFSTSNIQCLFISPSLILMDFLLNPYNPKYISNLPYKAALITFKHTYETGGLPCGYDPMPVLVHFFVTLEKTVSYAQTKICRWQWNKVEGVSAFPKISQSQNSFHWDLLKLTPFLFFPTRPHLAYKNLLWYLDI